MQSTWLCLDNTTELSMWTPLNSELPVKVDGDALSYACVARIFASIFKAQLWLPGTILHLKGFRYT